MASLGGGTPYGWGQEPTCTTDFLKTSMTTGVYLYFHACVVIRSVRNERIRCLTPRANCRHLNNNEYLRRWPRGGCRRDGG